MKDANELLLQLVQDVNELKIVIKQGFEKVNNRIDEESMKNFFKDKGFINIIPITEGLSRDKKYLISTEDKRQYFFKIKISAGYEETKADFDMFEQLYNHGVPMPKPIEIGICPLGPYIMDEALDEKYEGLRTFLSKLDNEENYSCGIEVGKILKKVHSSPIRNVYSRDWGYHFKKWAGSAMERYKKHEIHFEGEEYFIKILENYENYLKSEQICFLHWDFHAGNILVKNGDLKIIDFGKKKNVDGDPYKDFADFMIQGYKYPHFIAGMINEYFQDENDKLREFFISIKLYIVYNLFIMMTDSKQSHLLDYRIRAAKKVLKYYNNMKNDIPSWYIKSYLPDTF